MKELFLNYYNQYKSTLTDEVIPYWLKYAADESGAVNNCICEDGTLLSKDRYIWSQGRALWTFSAMYNRIEKKSEYLDFARGIFKYLLNIRKENGRVWNYLYSPEGKVKEGNISIYVDGFVLCGMTEYYCATGDEKAKEIALEIYEDTLNRLSIPHEIRVAPYVIPKGMKTHGVNMIFSFFYYNLGKALEREDICGEGIKLAREVLQKFYVKEKGAVLEFIMEDGSFSDTPEGRTCVPGHVIECMWFLINIFNDIGDKNSVLKCCELIKTHINLGLDREKGGLFLAMDIDGKEPVFWGKPTYKPWWVQLETLVATAYAYKHTGDEWYADIHKEINEFVYNHYPNGYGEWYNWLDNDGNVGESAALPVKDPFHLPRALIMLTQVLENITFDNENTVIYNKIDKECVR